MTVLIQLICFELRLMNFCGTVLYTDYNFDKKLLVCEGLKDIKCRNLSHTIDIVSVSFVNTKSWFNPWVRPHNKIKQNKI